MCSNGVCEVRPWQFRLGLPATWEFIQTRVRLFSIPYSRIVSNILEGMQRNPHVEQFSVLAVDKLVLKRF